MDALQTLMSYPLAEVVTIIVAALLFAKLCFTITDFFYDKIKKHFNIITKKEHDEKAFREEVTSMAKKIDEKELDFTNAIVKIGKMIEELKQKIVGLENYNEKVRERIQQNTRADLIDQYKRFTCDGYIDDLSFENFSIKYMYYTNAGGDSYVSDLMDNIRVLRQSSIEKDLQKIGGSE